MAVPLFDTSTPLAPLESEIAAKVAEIIASKRFIFGPEVSAFEDEFARYVGTKHALGVANGTDALLLALLGATPIWCDIDPSTFLMTAEHVREVLTPRTKAVIAVHLFGNVAPIEEI